MSSKKITARGLFPEAKVVRGDDWCWADQDGKSVIPHQVQYAIIAIDYIISSKNKVKEVLNIMESKHTKACAFLKPWA